jgi:L-aspartate oxidase
VHQLRADNTLLATGGAGQLFAVTTNPPEATGDGVAMALRAGVAVADLEFFQFHPTALAHVLMPRPLLSEALRGHGAMLRDSSGERFVDELLPRDVVSRAITAKMIEEGSRHVWLDATILHHFSLRFPTILADLEAAGLHPETDYLPVAPAAHHQCGGILTDLAGATSLPGLWAAGETSCSGVHGANRLASNSLLEGMVFGARVVEAIGAGATGPTHTGAMRSASLSATTDSVIGGSAVSVERPNFAGSDCPPEKIADLRSELQQSMTLHAGVLRSGASISAAHEVAVNVAAEVPRDVIRPDVCELRNLVEIASALLTAAASRTESRGSHSRTDFPAAQEIQRRRIVLNMAEASQ